MADADKCTAKRRQRFRLLSFWLVYALFLLLLAEVGSRAFWMARGVPFLGAARKIHWSLYPMVGQVEREAVSDDEDTFNVLMLGGSVLHTDYGDIEHVLRERLCRRIPKAVKIHNLSAPAHTSLDSFYKYRHLTDQRFDLVLLYHGINEVRANNCPRSVFRSDYSHFSWYKLINDYERRADSRRLVFPYTLDFVFWKIAGRLGWTGFLPTHEPDPESVNDGCDVKTKASLHTNLEGILTIAARKQEPVLLMSFVYYLPENYTAEYFGSRALDYTAHAFPVGLWGKPECVVAGMAGHNEVITDLARRHEQILFVDQDSLIPKEGRYFNDVCHLTHEGCDRFVDNMIDTILEGM